MIPPEDTAGAADPFPEPGYWSLVLRQLLRDRVAVLSGLVLLAMLVVIVFAPVFAPHDPYASSMLARLKPIGTPSHPLGTDDIGRDMLSRLIYGGRLSWLLGIAPVVIAFVIGGFLGVVAGYAGGRTNMVIMRVTDVFYAFPSVLLAAAISGSLGSGALNAVISMTLVFIPQITRVAESAATGQRGMDYVEAARASGAGPVSIIRVHVLPNVLGPIFVFATGLISLAMILASGLSFLGLGTQPPDPEWGLMLSGLRTAIYSQPLVTLLPGLCIIVTSLCFAMLSDGLRQAMDVRR
ncbi:MAG: ABC transporter permease [Rhodovulum sulfidophilum]|uniref:ABC transporter permease n=1 Tax=Rhodovulum sulfidophilum TaxID=35806 RepID=A0A2W5PYS1_RHOSU|nr:MAG: ABC transporter permease [Rhodovulum sulfidophilum]